MCVCVRACFQSPTATVGPDVSLPATMLRSTSWSSSSSVRGRFGDEVRGACSREWLYKERGDGCGAGWGLDDEEKFGSGGKSGIF